MEYKIVQRSSPNKMSRKGWKPDMIVSHITEGAFAGSVNWLCNPKSEVSSHFVVSKKGEITQLVDIKEAAWVNGTSVSPEVKSYYGNSKLKLVRDRKTNANYYTIGIEHEGIYSQGNGKLTPEQFNATVWLHKYIISEVKKIYNIDIPIDREHLVGHFEISPLTRTNCPGKAFQWDELVKELKGGNKVANKDTPSTWAKEAWEWVKKEGIFDGTNPTDVITREQVALVLHRLFLKGKLK